MDLAAQLALEVTELRIKLQQSERNAAEWRQSFDSQLEAIHERLKEGASRMAAAEHRENLMREELSAPIDVGPDDSVKMKLSRFGKTLVKRVEPYSRPTLLYAILEVLRLLYQ